MIQPIKRFSVTRLTMSGFKGYAERQTFQFGGMNVISGHMGVGKSSIADAVAFAITGVSFYGSGKLDYLYHKGTRDLLVELEYVDESGKARVLTRQRINDNMDITLDGVRVTQRDLTIMFGERDLFLSMFNPQYFINALGAKGRDLLERYMPEIPKENILDQLNEETRTLLEQQDFLSAEGYAKQVRSRMSEMENDMIYAQGQLDLRSTQQQEQAQELMEKQALYSQLQEQIRTLEARRTTGFDGSDLNEKLADLYARFEELDREPPALADSEALDAQIQSVGEKLARRQADTYQSQYTAPLSEVRAKVNTLSAEFHRLRHIHDGLAPGIQCPTCRQTVTEQTLPQVKQEFAVALRRIQAEGQQLTGQLKEIQALDAKAQAVFEQYRSDDITAGETQLAQLKQQRTTAVEQAEQQRTLHREELDSLHSEIQGLELDIECGMLTHEENEQLRRAKEQLDTLQAEVSVLTKQVQDAPSAIERRSKEISQIQVEVAESRKILNALALYISKRVELNFSALKMNRVSICLYDVVKTTGEVKDVFRFTYEGRDYICLSRSERIRAGLEVAELVKRLLGVEYPTFIDDVESVPVIDNVRPTGQVFIAKVVKGAALQVQASDNTAPAQAA